MWQVFTALAITDLTNCAKTIIFCVSFEAHAKVEAIGGEIKIRKRGKPKFVPSVSSISFSGAEALAAGKRVFYVTHLGAFELTAAGLTIICVFPGMQRIAPDEPFVEACSIADAFDRRIPPAQAST